MTINPIIAIDIGGTTIKAKYLDSISNSSVSPDIVLITDNANSYNGVIYQVLSIINELISLNGKPNYISISCPGIVDNIKGIVKVAYNLADWQNINLKDIIQKKYNIETYVNNDANCSAIAEWHFLSKKKIKNLAYITVSTGIGCGLIINNDLFVGKNFIAGELGHMIINYTAERCHECHTLHGCLTSYSSGPGILNYIDANLDKSSTLAFSSEKKAITMEMVSEFANKSDQLAIDALNRAGKSVGFAIINLMQLLDLEAIILGGGIINSGNHFIYSLKSVVDKFFLDNKIENILKLSILENTNGIIGAALYPELFTNRGK